MKEKQEAATDATLRSSGTQKDLKRERLAQALRANLRRRKVPAAALTDEETTSS